MTPKQQAVIEAADKYDRAQTAWDLGAENGMVGNEKDDLAKAHDALIAAVRDWRTFVITDAHIQEIMPKLREGKRREYLPHLLKAMADQEISTPLRAAAFLAQLAHESGELRFMQELWGPTDQQKKYEPPSDLAKRLGNDQAGDGFRYRGRGPIQLTGRANYKKYGELLGVDLVGDPDLAAKPEYAFQTAALYWKLNRCSELADVQDFVKITRAINGGLNGLADREKYYERAKEALGVKGE